MVLKIVFAGLITLLINIVFMTIQYFYQATNYGDDLFIYLGFPYDFFYFQPDFELHGSNMRHFIYDAFIWFVFSFLVVLAINSFRNKRQNKSENQLIDKNE